VRPAMMLFLRALVILGAVLAVIGCGFAKSLAPHDAAATPGGTEFSECARIPLSQSWATVPAAGSTGTASTGAGLCS
jgi:hypothetical protein